MVVKKNIGDNLYKSKMAAKMAAIQCQNVFCRNICSKYSRMAMFSSISMFLRMRNTILMLFYYLAAILMT